MTFVGKLLVFLNLVFSIVVGVFAIMTHAAGTDYKKANDAFAQRYQVLDASRTAYQQEAIRLRDERAALVKGLQEHGAPYPELKDAKEADKVAQKAIDMLNQRTTDVANLKKEVQKTTKDLSEARKTAQDAVTSSQTATADIQRRQNEAKNLRLAFEDASLKNVGLVKDLNDLRDRAVSRS